MIEKIKDNGIKIILIASVVLGVVILIKPTLFAFEFWRLGVQENKENNIANNYIELDKRKRYFKKNEYELNALVNYFTNYNDIESVGYLTCPSYKIVEGNINICVNKKVSDIPKIDIVNKLKKLEIKKIIKSDNLLIFYLIYTPEYRITFNYCLDVNNCSNIEEIESYSYGKLEKNVINERWSTSFSNIELR